MYFSIHGVDRRCVLEVIRCDAQGNKHFLVLEYGFHASVDGWKAGLTRMQDQGVNAAMLAHVAANESSLTGSTKGR